MWRLRPSVLRGAWWAARAARRVRKKLRTEGVRATVAPPPALPRSAARGVYGALSRLDPTCLERALVQQAWLLSQGRPLDVVIGVPLKGMRSGTAHAWVDGTDPVSPTKYAEIHRLPAVRS